MKNAFLRLFTPKYTFLLIAILLSFRLVTNWVLPVFDPSEARYANICSNMARSGNYLEPQFVYDGVLQTFEGKPPLYFQMGALSCRIFGVNEFAVRFPAMLSAIGILLLIFFTVKAIRGEKTACCAALLCALSGVFLVYGGLCMTDLLLAFSICAAVCFYVLFSSESKRFRKKLFSTLFFAAMGLGMIVKGPVALVMAGLPIFFFILVNNRWKELKDHAWFCGIAAFLLISAPWYWMMQAKNPDFLEYFFVNENFKRFLFKDYGDRYGAGRETFRGMAFLFMLLCNLPFPLLTAIFFIRKKFNRPSVRDFRSYLNDPLPGMAFLWLVTNTLFWCMTSRVLITYLLPTIPASVILAADLLNRCGMLEEEKTLYRLKLNLAAFGGVYCLLAIVICFYMPETQENAGHFFAHLNSLDQYRSCRIYFVKRTPLSAEFYFGNRVNNHPKELWTAAAEQNKGSIVLLTTSQKSMLGDSINRKEIGRFGPWIALAPEK